MPSNLALSPGERPNLLLLEKIWSNGCLLDAICDPRLFETHTAVTVARQMMGRYHNFDTRLATELMALPDVVSGKDHRIERCLEILDAVSSGRRIIMPMMQLMNSENPRVRSKLARLLGRRVDNLTWTRKFLYEVDDRTRANIVESLWGNDSPEVREVLWQAVQDANNRVRGNAILGLYRLGESGVLPAIRALAEDRAANVRATAAWLMGATGDPRFREIVKTLRQDTEASVRAAALRALVQLNKAEVNQAEVNQGQASRELLIRFCEDMDGVRRVGFDLADTAVPPRRLLPTEVVVTQKGGIVWGYTFAERQSRPLSALFLIFDGLDEEASAVLAEAFVECLDHKDADDRWSLVRVAAGAGGDLEVARLVPSPCRGAELKQVVAHFDQLLLVKTQEISKLVRLLGNEGPGRHLVLLLTPAALLNADLESLEIAAMVRRFSVDVISLSSQGNEQLQRVSRKTGGIFVVAPPAGISPEWMLQVYAGMVHRYEVTYPLEGSGDAALEIKIIPPRSKGAA